MDATPAVFDTDYLNKVLANTTSFIPRTPPVNVTTDKSELLPSDQNMMQMPGMVM